VTPSTVCDIIFELARHEFQRTFYVLLDFIVADMMVLGSLGLDDEQAFLQFGTTRVFTVMDGTTVETQMEGCKPECLLMSFGKIQKLMRETRRNKGRNAEFYEIKFSPSSEKLAEFNTGGEFNAQQHEHFRSLI
jgi:hypothetical protein